MNLQYRNSLLLAVTATIWGTGFVAQAIGVAHVSPFAFTFMRSLVGGLFLLAMLPVLDRLTGSAPRPAGAPSPWSGPVLWTGGVLCGFALFAAESFQQFGLVYTSVGKASFITSLYIVLVAVAGTYLGRRSSLNIWAAVVAAVAGLWLLCMKDGGFGAIEKGDILEAACAALFTVHILVIDRFAPHVDGVRLSCIQFFVGSLLGLACTLLFEDLQAQDVRGALGAVLYAGILSNGIAYTLQIIGQKGLNPTVASLIMSLEAVVGAVSGWLVLGHALTGREIAGCALMGAAVVLAQLPAAWFAGRTRGA